LNQEDVVEIMHTKKQAISRLELATDENKNSPSLENVNQKRFIIILPVRF
jgi:hypothetical protein